jgi:hypothetical protein
MFPQLRSSTLLAVELVHAVQAQAALLNDLKRSQTMTFSVPLVVQYLNKAYKNAFSDHQLHVPIGPPRRRIKQHDQVNNLLNYHQILCDDLMTLHLIS